MYSRTTGIIHVFSGAEFEMISKIKIETHKMYTGQKMEEVRQLIKKLIELEYKNALTRGLLDSRSVSNKIWNLLIDKNALHIPAPEGVSGCYENTED
jgi:hypothetical protein